jgi:hypothetical protein
VPVLGCFPPTTTTKKYRPIHTQHSHWPVNPDNLAYTTK